MGEDFEKLIRNCKNFRATCVDFKDEIVRILILAELLTSIFKYLQLKDKYFNVFISATVLERDAFWAIN